MKISYNWLKEYLEFEKTPEEVAQILTDTGLEVEGLRKIEAVQGGLEGVVVGEVLTCLQHPNADRLKITKVNVGNETLQIICGAPNVAEGQRVIVATPGTTLYPEPDKPFKIKKTKIRGEESNGMICAEDELGIGKAHDGIIVLDKSVAIGLNAAAYFELEDDYEIEIGLTPNRADAMGHLGVARDLKAYLNVHEKAGLELKLPDISSFSVKSQDLPIKIEVKDSDRCPRYMGLTIKDVKVASSPSWLQKRLRSIGLSPINNVVDVTNFVMHELGTPLHAFDVRELGGQVIVRTANKGEKFTTLDDVERSLNDSDLMITNGNDGLCIAGVFGGSESGIKDSTQDVFLESAYFNPVSIRKTAKSHGLNTDASFRYERGVDPEMTEFALKRAANLICELAGGSVSMDIVDINTNESSPREVEFNYERCNRLIGNEIPQDTVKQILNELDISIEGNGNTVIAKVPPYRVDVTREADLIEEILRIYGYNQVELPAKMNTSLPRTINQDQDQIQSTLSETLVGLGFSEAMNNSLTKSVYIEKFGGEAFNTSNDVGIMNPLSQDLDVMRQTLIFNMLSSMAYNQNRQNPDLKLFEFGKVYHKFETKYVENRRLLLAISGKKEHENWNSGKDDFSFYSIKGIASALLGRIGLSGELSEKALKKSLFEDGIQLSCKKKKVGQIGWISEGLKKEFGLKNDIFMADLDWDVILELQQDVEIKYQELPKIFAVRRDFSLLLDSNVSFAEIEEIARSCDTKLLQEVGLFDVYEGKNLDSGKKSYAVSFTFQDPEKTLQDKQIDAIMDKIRISLESKVNAQLR